jgi:hypothetical protein
MPDIKCLNQEVDEIKVVINTHTSRIDALSLKIDANTMITEGIKSDTQEIVELMKWGKTTRKVIFWIGSTAAGIWAMLEGIRHFK